MVENEDFLRTAQKQTDDFLLWLVGVVAKRHLPKFLEFKRVLRLERDIVNLLLNDLETMQKLGTLAQQRIETLSSYNEVLRRIAKIETGYDFDDEKPDKKEIH